MTTAPQSDRARNSPNPASNQPAQILVSVWSQKQGEQYCLATAKLSFWGKMVSLCWTVPCCWNIAPKKPKSDQIFHRLSTTGGWYNQALASAPGGEKSKLKKAQKFCTVQSHKHYLQNVSTPTIQYRILLLKSDPIIDYWVLYGHFFPRSGETGKTVLLGVTRHEHKSF